MLVGEVMKRNAKEQIKYLEDKFHNKKELGSATSLT